MIQFYLCVVPVESVVYYESVLIQIADAGKYLGAFPKLTGYRKIIVLDKGVAVHQILPVVVFVA